MSQTDLDGRLSFGMNTAHRFAIALGFAMIAAVVSLVADPLSLPEQLATIGIRGEWNRSTRLTKLAKN